MQTISAALSARPPSFPTVTEAVRTPADAVVIAALDRIGTLVTIRRDREVFAEGDAAAFGYKVLSGAVRTCKLLSDGRRQIGEFVLPGGLFGLEAVGLHRTSAEAVRDTVVLRYPRRQVQALSEASPAVSRWLCERAYAGLVEAQERMLMLGRKTAMERIASFLLCLADRSAGGSSTTVDLPMTRSDIADYLGLTIETVSRTLSHFSRIGTIVLNGAHRIVLVDRDALDKMAEFSRA
jgi:CRP/FNR family nitrogen fixation transcriptional regulator